jgi:hypothetical protein
MNAQCSKSLYKLFMKTRVSNLVDLKTETKDMGTQRPIMNNEKYQM